MQTKGGKPSVYFDGVDWLDKFTGSFINVTSTSYFSVSSNNLSSDAACIHTQSNSTNESPRTFNDTRTTGGLYRNLLVSASGTDGQADLLTANGSTTQRLSSSFIDASKNVSSFSDGGTEGTGAYTGTTQSNGLKLGAQLSAGAALEGHLQEFIAYNTDETSNRTSIETDINDYYSIY